MKRSTLHSIAPAGRAIGQATQEKSAFRFTPLFKELLLVFICIGLSCWAFAQDTPGTAAGPEPTGLRAYEKVYVVVAVLTTILAGFFIYVIRLDRKISKLEKE